MWQNAKNCHFGVVGIRLSSCSLYFSTFKLPPPQYKNDWLLKGGATRQ